MAEGPSMLSEQAKQEVQEAAKGGIAMLKEYMSKKNDEWKEIPLNIGITGESGVGKSSFINAIRNVTADDEGGAHVDNVEATRHIKKYYHPSNKNLAFWDLPGVGTPNFPRATYLTTVKFEQFDFFLIFSAARFREDDLWLAKEIRKLGKKFHFVRTQMEVEVEKDKKGHPKTHTRDKVIDNIRKDCEKNVEKHGLTGATVFLIDNYAPLDFDFNTLSTTLIDEAPMHKKEAMTLSLSVLTKGVIERKVESLKKRIWGIAIVSAAGGGIPVPGFSAVVDGALLLEELAFYKKQFGLDDKTMEEHARLLATETDQLKKKLGLQSTLLATTARGIVQAISGMVASEAIESTLPIVLPLIGSIISAGISYGITVAGLRHILKLCADDALKINNELVKVAL